MSFPARARAREYVRPPQGEPGGPGPPMKHGRQWDGVPRAAGTRPIVRAQMDFLATLDEVATEEIIERWARGARVEDITNALGVGRIAFYIWKKSRPEVFNAWAEAKAWRAQSYADDAMEAADAPAGRDEKGRPTRPTPEDVQHGHLKAKVKMWLAAVTDPQAFGKQPDVQVNLTVMALQAAKEVNQEDTARRMLVLDQPREALPYEVVSDDERAGEDLL